MILEVASALESDIDRLMEIQFSAFDSDPYHEAVYPGANSPLARASAGERVLKEWHEDPSLHILKCTDLDTGVIMGFAKWNLYERPRPEREWRKREEIDWCDGRLKEVAESFLGATQDMREKIWDGRPHCCKPLFPPCEWVWKLQV
jgi:hypothetical protein